MNFRYYQRIFIRPLIIALFVLLGAGAASAQSNDTSPSPASSTSAPLTVGVYVSPPFVMAQDDGFTGMAIDLWNMLTEKLGLQSRYVEFDTLRSLVDATAAGDIDIAVTNLTITRDRAERIDFTHPWFDAGLRIMVREDTSSGFGDLIAGLMESGHLRAYAWIALVIVAITVILTLFDRHFDKNFPRRWRDGIAESFYTVMSVATSGKPPSRKNLFGWVGRIWQAVWLVCGIAVLAYVTSSVTSVMTTLALTNQINSVADLSNRPVGVFTGSVAEQYAAQTGLDARSYAHLDEAVSALLAQRIDAIIGDAPVLEYFAHTHPDRAVTVVGTLIDPDKYGFGLPQESELTRALSIELIGAHESGQLDEIKTKYFGATP